MLHPDDLKFGLDTLDSLYEYIYNLCVWILDIGRNM